MYTNVPTYMPNCPNTMTQLCMTESVTDQPTNRQVEGVIEVLMKKNSRAHENYMYLIYFHSDVLQKKSEITFVYTCLSFGIKYKFSSLPRICQMSANIGYDFYFIK